LPAPFYFGMNGRTISIKAGWLLSLRLATYVVIAVIVIYGIGYPKFINAPFLTYSILTLLLPVLFILKRWFDVRFLLKALPFLQILLEIMVEAGVIYITGNISSAYSGLFVLTIISAALVTNLVGVLGIASLISICYAFVVWFGLGFVDAPGSATRALEVIFSSQDAGFYNIFLHILTFFLVAFISGYLVERLKIQDRELADTSLALKQAKLETDDILRHLNSGLFTIDKEGRIIFFNRAAEEILGYKESNTRGYNFKDIFRGRMPQMAEILTKALDSKKHSDRNEIEIINAEGRKIPIGISTSLLGSSSNDIRGIIAIFQDLSTTKILEEKIRQADRLAAVGELSAAIAHEIRNPLAAVSGSVEVLKKELNVGGENLRLMQLIDRETSRLNNILSDFLLFARSRRSAVTRVELCHLIGDVIEVIRHHPCFNENITLGLLAEDSFIYVFGDEDEIKQILINLIVNACEAIGNKPGRVTLTIEKNAQKKVMVKVVDNGPGIDASVKKRIFDPFYSTKKNGTGMGLAIVQRLTCDLDIDLSCQSSPGEGTIFLLEFNQSPGYKPFTSEKDACSDPKPAATF
jgi:two-component system sensor histidine kinase PilS (NtrC family)